MDNTLMKRTFEEFEYSMKNCFKIIHILINIIIFLKKSDSLLNGACQCLSDLSSPTFFTRNQKL